MTVPDNIQVLTQLENGGRGIYQHSGVILGGPGKQIHLYGERATIKVHFTDDGGERVEICTAGETEMKPVEIPEKQRGRWRVEREFVASIRHEEQVEMTDFATGVRYMEFVEAVAQSAETNQPVKLPLTQ